MELNLRNRQPVETPPEPVAPVPEPLPIAPTPVGKQPNRRVGHLFEIFLGLAVGFLAFYVLADYTSYTTGQIHPGELVFSNTMIQLWTATYRLAYSFMLAMGLIGLVWQGLWQFFRPSEDRDFDLLTSIRYDLTPAQRIWLFFVVFFTLCFLFILLLSAKLPESVSVSP